MFAAVRRADSEGRAGVGAARGLRAWRGISLAAFCLRASCPMRTRATCSSICSFPNAASLERTATASRDVEKILSRHAWGSVHHQRGRIQLAQLRPHQLQRLLFCHLKALEDARNESGTVSGDQGALEPGARRASAKEPFSASRRRQSPASAPRRISVRAGGPAGRRRLSFWQTTWPSSWRRLASVRKLA